MWFSTFWFLIFINPLASPSAGAPALKYGDVNTETTSPGEVKGLIDFAALFKSTHLSPVEELLYIINP